MADTTVIDDLYVGVDTGGTFTDVVVMDGAGGVTTNKAPTTPHALEEGVLAALTLIADERGQTLAEMLAQVVSFGHGTTQATNALIDSLPLTQDRSAGFKDALSDCGLSVGPRVAADFTVAGGEAAASQMLSANPKIDAIWNHDDDQGVGVMAAIDSAGRSEFFMVGGAGSKNAMDLIKAGDTPLQATVVYPSTQAADGVALARLIAQGKTMSDLITPSVPNRVVLDAPVVTKENVDEYYDLAFAS